MSRKRPPRKYRDIAEAMEAAAKAPPPPCRFCGASVEMPNEDALTRMAGCNNCRIDIELRGGWTGIGWGILRAIKARRLRVEHG